MIVEEGGSEHDLACEGFDRFSDRTWILVEHVTEMGADNGEYQHVMFPVYSTHGEMLQEDENVIGAGVFTTPFGSCRKVTVDDDLVVPACKF
jgi:hypothetical protein